MCKSIANQTTDWLTCKKQTNHRPCMVSTSITFSIELCFQWTYACTWSGSESLRNGCKILLFYKSAQKWAERRQLFLWGFYYYVTWKLKLDQSWHTTTLFTKSLTGMWPDLGGIFFLQTFFVAVWPSSTWFCWQP